MSQTTPQFELPLLRMGSIAFLAGLVIFVVSTEFHAFREDPNNHPRVFAEYANSNPWIAAHIGQFVGGIVVFAGGFVALYRLLVQSESSRTASALAWIGFAVAIIAASTLSILQAVDGIALKRAVDSWASAPTVEKAAAFRVAEGIRWIEIGTNSIFRILQGTVALIFGIAIAMSTQLSRWIGGAGVFAGAITIAAGVEVAYIGFASSHTGLGAVSMIIYSIWVGILGIFMLRKTMSI
jgi:Domain of unknown function (DUF4386)